MTATESRYPMSKYDARHDVLHVFLASQRNAYADEEYPGIYVNRNDDTNQIVGFTILDFKENELMAKKLYPQFEFSIPK